MLRRRSLEAGGCMLRWMTRLLAACLMRGLGKASACGQIVICDLSPGPNRDTGLAHSDDAGSWVFVISKKLSFALVIPFATNLYVREVGAFTFCVGLAWLARCVLPFGVNRIWNRVGANRSPILEAEKAGQ